MEYVVGNKKFNISYQALREQHYEFCNLSDEDFKKRLPEAIHIAVIICWLKELSTECVLSDSGIVHELVHLLHIPNNTVQTFQEIREQFKNILKLN